MAAGPPLARMVAVGRLLVRMVVVGGLLVRMVVAGPRLVTDPWRTAGAEAGGGGRLGRMVLSLLMVAVALRRATKAGAGVPPGPTVVASLLALTAGLVWAVTAGGGGRLGRMVEPSLPMVLTVPRRTATAGAGILQGPTALVSMEVAWVDQRRTVTAGVEAGVGVGAIAVGLPAVVAGPRRAQTVADGWQPVLKSTVRAPIAVSGTRPAILGPTSRGLGDPEALVVGGGRLARATPDDPRILRSAAAGRQRGQMMAARCRAPMEVGRRMPIVGGCRAPMAAGSRIPAVGGRPVVAVDGWPMMTEDAIRAPAALAGPWRAPMTVAGRWQALMPVIGKRRALTLADARLQLLTLVGDEPRARMVAAGR